MADALESYRMPDQRQVRVPLGLHGALELAPYRTCVVPGIGRLPARTAELTERPQKRCDDSVLLLETVAEHDFAALGGRTAIRRINQMHRSYDISNVGTRYVLSTFVVMPQRWIEAHRRRRLSRHEIVATPEYYRTLSRHMGIPDIPRTYEEFETFPTPTKRPASAGTRRPTGSPTPPSV